MNKIFKDFIKEEKGQTMVEWIVILALVLVVIIAIVQAIGKRGSSKAKEIEKVLK